MRFQNIFPINLLIPLKVSIFCYISIVTFIESNSRHIFMSIKSWTILIIILFLTPTIIKIHLRFYRTANKVPQIFSSLCMIQRNTNMRTWIQYHTKSPWTIISKYTFLRSLQNSKKILCNTMLFFQRRIRSNMKIKCRQMTSKHNYTNKHNKCIYNT